MSPKVKSTLGADLGDRERAQLRGHRPALLEEHDAGLILADWGFGRKRDLGAEEALVDKAHAALVDRVEPALLLQPDHGAAPVEVVGAQPADHHVADTVAGLDALLCRRMDRQVVYAGAQSAQFRETGDLVERA